MMYLAVHGNTVVDLTAWPVRVDGPVRFPAPASRHAAAAITGARVPLDDDYAVRVISVTVRGDTIADAEDTLNALKRACETYRAKLYWRSSESAPMLYTTIRHAYVTESDIDWLERNDGTISATLTLTTDSEWTGEAVEFAPDPITGPDTLAVTVAQGDRPARTRLKLTSASANTAFGIGVAHEAGEDFEPIDTYETPSAVNLTSTYAALGTAPAIDTNDNRGSYVVVPRVTTNPAAAASTRYRCVASVTGAGVATSATATHHSIAARATGAYRYTALPGLVAIPAGAVPDIQTGSGVGPEAVLVEQDTATGAYSSPGGWNYYRVGQTVVLAAGALITAFEYTVTVAPTTVNFVTLEVRLGSVSGSVVSQRNLSVANLSVGTHKINLTTPFVSAGGTYAFCLYYNLFNAFSLATASGQYADGVMFIDPVPVGGGPAAGTDMQFTVYGQTSLSFDTATSIQASCAEGSKTATLSHTVRLPADDFAAVVYGTFGADEGIMLEATDPFSDPVVYETTEEDGHAGPALAPAVWHGSPRLRPGVNTLVVAGEGTITVAGQYYPCYSNAAAGSL